MATIPVVCACGKRLQAREEAAGTTAMCPSCRGLVQIPSWVKPDPAGIDVGLELKAVPGSGGLETARGPRLSRRAVGVVLLCLGSAAFGLVASRSLSSALRQPAPVESAGPTLYEHFGGASPEERLAILETLSFVARDDPRVAGYRRLLDQVGTAFIQGRPEIADGVMASTVRLREKGLDASPREILEVLTWFYAPDPKYQEAPRDLREYLECYEILRVPNRCHTQAAMLFVSTLQVMEGLQKDALRETAEAEARAREASRETFTRDEAPAATNLPRIDPPPVSSR